MYPKQGGITSSGRFLKLVDRFTYLSSNILSTESNVNIHIAKVWTDIDHMEVWSIRLNKTGFLPRCGCVNIIVWMHHIDTNKMHGEKARWELHKNAMCYSEHISEATPHKITAERPLAPYRKIIQVRWTRHAGHSWKSNDERLNKNLLWTPKHRWASVGWPARTN